MKIAVFASGTGSNFQAIIDAVNNGVLVAQISCLICDKPEAKVIERATKAGIETLVLTYKEAGGKDSWERQVIDYLKRQAIDLIVLAGFMRIIGQELLEAYPNRILNIHPSLLPNFPGANGIQDAYEAGVVETGVTIHWIDAGVDTGPIIVQERLKIEPEWSLANLETAIHQIEHQLYPKTIQTLIQQMKSF